MKPEEKYYGREFNDPILRCDDCQALINRNQLRKFGCCNKCGNRKLKNVQLIKQEEMWALRNHTYFKDGFEVPGDFLELFEGVPDEG